MDAPISTFSEPSEKLSTKTTVPALKRKKAAVESKKYKMMICKNWEKGFCRFGDACLFAHGEREVKSVNLYYKTRLCKDFHSVGFCKFGQKCQFLHLEKRRLPIFEEIEKKGEALGEVTSC